MSFLDAGRIEPVKGGRDEEEEARRNDEAWDVYADFNNAGPRYSTAFGLGHTDAGYQQLPPPPSIPQAKTDDASSTRTPVELVTVPALGPEWNLSEMKDMTQAGKREKKYDKRRAFWKAWNRGDTGLCGKWFTKKFLVFFVFAWVVIIVILLAITIPRVPGFSFNSTTPLDSATGSFNASIPSQFSRSPANFSFPALADLEVDTTSNILPLTFNSISAEIYDTTSNLQVASGNFGHTTLSAKTFSKIQIPLNFSYVATNTSDPTWNNWYNACKNPGLYPSGTRPGISFILVLKMYIAGLPSAHGASTQVTDASCPIQLSMNSA
ncbi:hypothetical protein SERLA73DRAFT_123361 [Serpula lacrymans var. lacrymans S7.3]|uniref:Uncharacterized protein n=2 Tax=Serpula lacrymans var. lacrymans TaxID=341189 RepID=F8Q0W6_SERL3|nr:hypothetical protein SERLA73DRAFT_123361 [Serpula lacrymans var. lacrymans S7.3]